MILKMLQIQAISVEGFYDLFNFRETKSFNTKINAEGEEVSKYEQAGIESSNFFLMMGPVLLMIPAFVIFYILKALCTRILAKCGDNFITRRVRGELIVMVIILRFLLEGCTEIGLSAMICVLSVSTDFY